MLVYEYNMFLDPIGITTRWSSKSLVGNISFVAIFTSSNWRPSCWSTPPYSSDVVPAIPPHWVRSTRCRPWTSKETNPVNLPWVESQAILPANCLCQSHLHSYCAWIGSISWMNHTMVDTASDHKLSRRDNWKHPQWKLWPHRATNLIAPHFTQTCEKPNKFSNILSKAWLMNCFIETSKRLQMMKHLATHQTNKRTLRVLQQSYFYSPRNHCICGNRDLRRREAPGRGVTQATL